MNRLKFVVLSSLGLVVFLPQEQGQDERTDVPGCPVCHDLYPNLIDTGTWECNECGVLFRKAQHNKRGEPR